MSYDATGYGYNGMDEEDPYGQAAGAGMDGMDQGYYGEEMDENVITQEDW